MSPYPSNKRRKSRHSSPTADEIEASNKTTRLMMGTVPRSWMLDSPNTDAPLPSAGPYVQRPPRPRIQTLTTTNTAPVDCDAPSAARESSSERDPALATVGSSSVHGSSSLATPWSAMPSEIWSAPYAYGSPGSASRQMTLPQQYTSALNQHTSSSVPAVRSTFSRSDGQHFSPLLGLQQPQFPPSPAPSDEQATKSPRQAPMVGSSDGHCRRHSMQSRPASRISMSNSNIHSPSIMNHSSPITAQQIALAQQQQQRQQQGQARVKQLYQQQKRQQIQQQCAMQQIQQLQQLQTPQQQVMQRQQQQQQTRIQPQVPFPENGTVPSPRQMNYAGQQQASPISAPNPFNVFSKSACLPRLTSFVQVNEPSHSALDKRRLKMLAHASNVDDCFFMTASLLVASRHIRDYILPVTDPPIDMNGLIVLETIMGADEDTRLSPRVLAFVQTFPMPLSVLCNSLGVLNFQRVCNDVASCIAALCNWERLVQFSGKRQSLPLARDLQLGWFIKSIVLQTAAFNAILRRTWGSDATRPAQQALSHFANEQQAYHSSEIVSHPDTHYQLYNRLYLEHLPLHRAAAAAAGSATISASGPAPRQVHFPMDHPSHVAASYPATISSDLRQADYATTVPQTASRSDPPSNAPRLLIPPHGAQTYQYARPDPTRLALHQAHLRDPVLEHSSITVDSPPEELPLYFRYVSGFLLPPRPLSAELIQEIHFSMSQDQQASIPEFTDGKGGSPPVVLFDSTKMLFRLRCCRRANGGLKPWMVEETDWPLSFYLSLNGSHLEVRRKLQHGKCLPIDITRHLREENTLEIYVNHVSGADPPSNYAVAVEMVTFADQVTLRAECLTKRVRSADKVRASIISSLTQSQGTDDDDIAIIQSAVTIPMFEPYSNAKMFDIPVRGIDCAHRHAFDLDVFLQTRTKQGDTLKVSKTDDWKCPICGGDARPPSLIVDGFLQEVRRDLASKGLLETRAITVDADGVYSVKPETKGSGKSSVVEVGDGGSRGSGSKTIDLIEIDSD